ncbi:hypothetical protein [Polluticoccus soli]|uniref:hypothetical protein n=1 Tax=Polluticoccus soli TaxID=3034150 RepID=UPI0023E19F49|nr:hypothetical protein [Flavipsychrobacter sp. JY13-12]
MQRIHTLLQKLNDLSKTDSDNISAIDIDLMLDYTRVMYADLLEWKNRKQFSENLAPTMVEDSVQDETESPSIPSGSAPSVELTSQIQSFEAPADQIEPTTVTGTDIRKYIGINDKFQFISELFGNDKEAYDQVLDNLNKCTNYSLAVEWLDEHAHSRYGWKDDQFAVQSFYDTLSSFFASR